MQDYTIIHQCLLCHHTELVPVLSLPPTPLANQFVKQSVIQNIYPLDLVQCQNCQHVQLSCIVDPEILYCEYVYVSGTSTVTRQHFHNYAEKLIKNYKLNQDNFVVDIGSNDGTFLSNFNKQNIKVLGIDPAWQAAKVANNNGIKTWAQFFNAMVAKEIVKEYGHADIICANNVFAHNANLDTITEGINHLLKDDGIFVFEVSYLMDVLDMNGFDLIYHEHIHQHHLTPLIQYFNKFKMHIFDVECLDIQCGSIRVYVSKNTCHKYPISSHVRELLQLEKVLPLKLNNFGTKILQLKEKLVGVLQDYKSKGKNIVGYGAAAKSTTSLYYFGLGIETLDVICDDNEWKIGLLSPRKHIPIVSPQYLYDKKPDVCLILSCNFAESIIHNHSKFKGQWIIPMPKVKEVSGE